MKKVNEILLIMILILTAVLVAAVGLKAYDIYDTDRRLAREQEEIELAQVFARNEEAQSRVHEMQAELLQLTEDKERLEQFIMQIQNGEAGRAADGAVLSEESVSGNSTVSGNDTMSGNGKMYTDGTMSGNGMTYADGMMSGNSVTYMDSTVSGDGMMYTDGTVSGNGMTYADGMMSGNGAAYTDGTVSGNGVTYADGMMSGNSAASGNGKMYTDGTVSGNGMTYGDGVVSGNGTMYADGAAFGNGKMYTDGAAFGNGMMYTDGTVSGNGMPYADGMMPGDGAAFGNGKMYTDGTAFGNGMMYTDGTVSGNGMTYGDGVALGDGTASGNDTWQADGTPFGNDVPGGLSDHRKINYYDGTMTDNSIFDAWRSIYEQPEGMTLAERRLLRNSLEETLEVNQSDRERIAENRQDFSGLKIACLGDSITAAANLEEEEDYQQYSYPEKLKQLLGAEEVYNLGIGGSSIGRYWADAYVDRYQEIPEDADVIIVMGGTNDGFCVSDKEFGSLEERAYRTFCGDLDELMGGLRVNYPSAQIFFATPLPNILQDYLMSERDYLLPQQDFVDVILTLAQEYDYEVIDLYNSNILDSHDANIVADYIPDGVHGNHDGYQIMAEHFASEIIQHYEDAGGFQPPEAVSDNDLQEDPFFHIDAE